MKHVSTFVLLGQQQSCATKALTIKSILIKHISVLDSKALPKAAFTLTKALLRRLELLYSFQQTLLWHSGGSCCRGILQNSFSLFCHTAQHQVTEQNTVLANQIHVSTHMRRTSLQHAPCSIVVICGPPGQHLRRRRWLLPWLTFQSCAIKPNGSTSTYNAAFAF